MNVLFITNSIGYGGVEKIVNFVSDSVIKSGNNAIVLNLNTEPLNVTQQTQVFNDRVKLINLEHSSSHRNIHEIRCIVSIIRSERISVIIGFTLFPNFYAKIASLITGVPSIMSERGNPFATITNSFKDKIVKFMINRSAGGVFQTDGAASFYSKGLQKRGIVIPNPIFLTTNQVPNIQNQPRQKSVVWVGRLQNNPKRMDIMLKAFKLFSTSHPEYILKMYGSGDHELVQDLSKELQIEHKVLLMGVCKNPMIEIYKDGMYVLTSDSEGIPNALLEAMAVGLPVISTDCKPGGAKFIIKNGENGQLVPIGDYHSVAKAMCKYVDEPKFADFCGKNARLVLDRFSLQTISEMWINYLYTIAHH